MRKIADTPRHLIPDNIMQNIARDTMRAHFQILVFKGRAVASQTAEQFYGFRSEDVEEMHFCKHGFGRGVWYRLKNDLVIDALGKPSEVERHWYGSLTN
jgi:hypothetical protein